MHAKRNAPVGKSGAPQIGDAFGYASGNRYYEVIVRSIRGDGLHTDYVSVGHSANLAARTEQMATPGLILLAGYTRRLVEGYFEQVGWATTQPTLALKTTS